MAELQTFSFLLKSGKELKLQGTNYDIEELYVKVYDDCTEIAVIPFSNLKTFGIDSSEKKNINFS